MASSSSSLLRPLSTASGGGAAVHLCPDLPLRLPFLPLAPRPLAPKHYPLVLARARGGENDPAPPQQSKNPKDSTQAASSSSSPAKAGAEEVEEELPWIQEKALDLVEFTGTVTQAIPGPRVGKSPVPWLLAVPLAWVGLSFVFAFVKTVRKFTSPKAKRKKLVNKNAFLLKSIDELFSKGKEEVTHSALKGLMQKTGFTGDDILRKYIRYTLNEKPFNPDVVVDLIHLRKASMLEDAQVAEVLNETARRIVKEKAYSYKGSFNIWYQSYVEPVPKFFFAAAKMTTESSFIQPAIPRFDGYYDHWSMLMENFLCSKVQRILASS